MKKQLKKEFANAGRIQDALFKIKQNKIVRKIPKPQGKR